MLREMYYGKRAPTAVPSYLKRIMHSSDVMRSPSEFELKAFVALLNNVKTLGISEIYQCCDARGDGCLRLEDDSWIMLEIKECLYFGPMCTAFVQCMMAQKLCRVPTASGLIIFARFGSDWIREKRKKVRPNPWAMFDRHVVEFRHAFGVDALQLTSVEGVDRFSPGPGNRLLLK